MAITTSASHFRHGLLAIRPKTLGISLAPVITGAALAWQQQGYLNWASALACLLGALLIQVGTNLHNDAADYERGADTEERLGPARATAEGWFTAKQIKLGALFSFGMAFSIGIYLVWIGGWPIVWLGLASLAAGYAYTGGPRPIAYSPSGELFVFLFFGLAAVGGTYYLQTFKVSTEALMLGSSIGLLAAAVLLVNNYRDLETDIKANKKTLVFYLGRERSQWIYVACLLMPYVLVLSLPTMPSGTWLILAALPISWRLIRRFFHETEGAGFNIMLAGTAKHQLIFSLLLALGLKL